MLILTKLSKNSAKEIGFVLRDLISCIKQAIPL